jgi:transposase
MHNFLLIQKQKDEEIASLDTLIKSNPDPRELKRALAVKMAIEGQTHKNIAQLLGVSQYFVVDWKKAFKTSGIAGLKLGYKGAKKYLSDEQTAETIEWLTNKKYWHLDELVNYLDEKYDVVYKSKQSYYNLFSTAQISWKRSQKTNPKFDEELVKKKREEINTFLAKNQTQIELGQMVVLFLDECHLLSGDVCGYVWGRTDTRIEVPLKNEKERQTYFGALNYQTKEFTIKGYPAGNGESTVEFVKYLQSKYPQAKIVLIWDGASYHRFGEFRDFLEKVNNETPVSERQINCILFAPNAPQQNPVEDVWLQAKNFLRKYWHLCQSFRAIKVLFEFFTDSSKFDFPKIGQYQPAG